jgi:lipopolysaccharide heptosyltransferase II
LEEALMDRLVFAIYRLVSAAIDLMPIADVFRLGWTLGTAAYYIAWPYRRLVLRNLHIAFGEEKSPEELRGIARKHFATLGANLFSNIKLPRMSREEILSVVTVEGLETLQAGNAVRSGFVMVINHIGSWEMFAQLSPIVFGCPVGTIFQALSNPDIDAEVRSDRARLGLKLFERKEGFIQACQFMREGGAVGVLVDQHAGDAGQWCPFFGRLASTSTLAATLALRTGAWLVPAAVHTDGVARWRCVILPRMEPQGQNAEQITVRINQTLEQMIRRQPEDWFWVHNRWKRPNPKFLLATYKRGVTLAEGQKPESLKPFRILIRASNWLGDAVMSVPAVRAIKRGRVDAHVTILTPAKLADVWKTVPEVDDVIAIEWDESVFAVARKLRHGDFEVAIVFPNSLRTALEVWLAGISRRIGYPGHHRRRLLNQVFAPKKKKTPLPPEHQVYHYLALAESVGAIIPADAAHFPISNQQSAIKNPILGLCPGAEYGPAKRWIPERFAEVVRTVHERAGAEWRIFGVAKDRPVADAIIAAAGVPCSDRVGKTSLAQLIDELRACDLLLTNDTGTMHLAAFLGVPTVSIFGSTEPALTGPLGPSHRVLRHHVECSPCFLRECPIDFRCMKAIQVPEVVEAVLGALPNRT